MTVSKFAPLDFKKIRFKRGRLTFVYSKTVKDFYSLIKKGFISKNKVIKKSNDQEILKSDPSWLVTNKLGIQDFDKIKVLFEETKDIRIGSNNIVCFTINAQTNKNWVKLNLVKLCVKGCGENMKLSSKKLNSQIIFL
ncbi:hypothetical protein [Spiroplasma monobiae]|uniref:Uncharacterized protein n=1 Tax=Spiroplasma monobiae MQ-1 TaxID=1336748 RepID=A0A2K9LUR8_SPISQ|nr:hypothetical protein [Spiroplasma monobiae]AUM62770.1 hypothetical protein SMONO_v1c05210 [Spiroplasma monobiae MQ-1]